MRERVGLSLGVRRGQGRGEREGERRGDEERIDRSPACLSALLNSSVAAVFKAFGSEERNSGSRERTAMKGRASQPLIFQLISPNRGEQRSLSLSHTH